eukprot:IDg6494t1
MFVEEKLVPDASGCVLGSLAELAIRLRAIRATVTFAGSAAYAWFSHCGFCWTIPGRNLALHSCPQRKVSDDHLSGSAL